MTTQPRSLPNIHITRTPAEAKGNNHAQFELTFMDSARPDTLDDLAQDVAKRLTAYSNDVRLERDSGRSVLRFVADKQPLDKYAMGRLNQQAIIAHVDRLEGLASV